MRSWKRIKDKYGVAVSFRIIGDENYYCNELENGHFPGGRGIMPLPNDEWTKGKCGLKPAGTWPWEYLL